MKVKKLTAAELVELVGKRDNIIRAPATLTMDDEQDATNSAVIFQVDLTNGELIIDGSSGCKWRVDIKEAPAIGQFISTMYPVTKTEKSEKKTRKKRETKAEKLSNQVKYEAPEGESLAM